MEFLGIPWNSLEFLGNRWKPLETKIFQTFPLVKNRTENGFVNTLGPLEISTYNRFAARPNVVRERASMCAGASRSNVRTSAANAQIHRTPKALPDTHRIRFQHRANLERKPSCQKILCTPLLRTPKSSPVKAGRPAGRPAGRQASGIH